MVNCPLRGKNLAKGLSEFHQERCDQVPPGETPEQGSAEPDLRDDEGEPCYRGSYERGASLVQLQAGVRV